MADVVEQLDLQIYYDPPPVADVEAGRSADI